MRKRSGNKWAKSWHNPKARYPMFRCTSGGSPLGWLEIVLLIGFLLFLFFL